MRSSLPSRRSLETGGTETKPYAAYAQSLKTLCLVNTVHRWLCLKFPRKRPEILAPRLMRLGKETGFVFQDPDEQGGEITDTDLTARPAIWPISLFLLPKYHPRDWRVSALFSFVQSCPNVLGSVGVDFERLPRLGDSTQI